ncbi:MAG: ankyrin repeat domain-containing protein [Proteobacteria bacterium]|nr:ankyrin repeat domain-containing protein [Pseudomonadota bacterium]
MGAWIFRVAVMGSVSVFAATATAQPVPAPPPKAPAKAPTKKSATKPLPQSSQTSSQTSGTIKPRSQPTLALFKAVELNDLKAIKSSIEAGADLFAENEAGMTAADVAVDQGYFIVAHYLLSRRMLGQSPPIALVPGKTKETAIAAKAKAKAKPKFASPRPKPPMAPAAPSTETEIAAAPKPQEPMRIEVGPAPAPAPALAPAKGPSDTPEAVELIAEIPASNIAEATDKVVEVNEATDEPLAKQGFGNFFKSLVDLITPGGEEPPKMAKKEEPAPPEPKTDVADAVPSTDNTPLPVETTKKSPFDEAIVETVANAPDEIVVEVTGDVKDGLVDESIEEVSPDTPLTLVEGDIETLTAVPDNGEKAKDSGKVGQEGSFLDRMASLFTSEAKPGDAKKGDTKKTDKKGKAESNVDAVREYDLPLPPSKPLPARKMSPRFLDNLADFLKTGDEEAFQAWLPETQILNPEALNAKKVGPPPAKAAAQEFAAAPAPDKAPKPPVLQSPLVDSQKPWSTADKQPRAPAPTTKEAGTPGKEAGTEAPAEKPGMIKGVFNKLVDVLTPDFGSRERPERLILEPEEKLAQADINMAEKNKAEKMVGEDGKAGDGEAAPRYWPITEVETAEKPPVSRRKSPQLLKTSLSGVTLTLGQSVSLENSYPPMGNNATGVGIDPSNQCVKKNRGTTLFCLETVDWPEKMQPDFLVPTILYTGQKAIARYDQGIASRFHALFPSPSFKRIAQYLTERYGEPTDAWNRSIAPFAQPRQDNPILTWRSIDPKSQVITVLEIRKFDDTRGGFPDTNRGAVMLYLANSPPIFPQVSSHELMRISRTRLNQIPPVAAGVNPSALPPSNTPANIDDTLKEAAPKEAPVKKSLKEMTAEEIQAERRKNRTKKSRAAPAQPNADAFDLPPDPLNR